MEIAIHIYDRRMFDMNRYRDVHTLFLFDDEWDNHIVYEIYIDRAFRPAYITDDITKIYPININVGDSLTKMSMLDIGVHNGRYGCSYVGENTSFNYQYLTFFEVVNSITDRTYAD